MIRATQIFMAKLGFVYNYNSLINKGNQRFMSQEILYWFLKFCEMQQKLDSKESFLYLLDKDYIHGREHVLKEKYWIYMLIKAHFLYNAN